MSAVSKRRIWGWMSFDWASQPFYTLGLTFVFGPYFASVAIQYYMGQGLSEQAADAQAQSLWFTGSAVAGVFIALSAPYLGAVADRAGRRIPWIALFSAIYILCTAALWKLTPDGSWLFPALIIFFVGFIAAEYALNFVNAYLPGLGTDEEIGRISGSGAAFGYWGGVLALAIVLLLLLEVPGTGKTLLGQDPLFGLDVAQKEETRIVGPLIALWFAIFMIPFFLFVRDEPQAATLTPKKGSAWKDLMATLKSIRHRTSLVSFLIGSMCYRDALNAIYTAGGIYAAVVMNWELLQIVQFGIIAALAAAVLTWVGGLCDTKFGPKPVILVCVLLLIGVSITVVCLGPNHFLWFTFETTTVPNVIYYCVGMVIGGAGGTIYSASRSMMVRHTTPDRPTEAFGLFALSGKATAFIGPLLVVAVTEMTGSAQLGYIPVIILFIVGLILLRWVNKDGDRDEWVASQG